MVRIGAHGRRQDGGREDADAVGAEILKEPGDRGQHRGPDIGGVEERRVGRTAAVSDGRAVARRELDVGRVLRVPQE